MKRQPMPKTVEGTIITRRPASHAAALGLHLLHKYMNGSISLIETAKLIAECSEQLQELADALALAQPKAKRRTPETNKKPSRNR